MRSFSFFQVWFKNRRAKWRKRERHLEAIQNSFGQQHHHVSNVPHQSSFAPLLFPVQPSQFQTPQRFPPSHPPPPPHQYSHATNPQSNISASAAAAVAMVAWRQSGKPSTPTGFLWPSVRSDSIEIPMLPGAQMQSPPLQTGYPIFAPETVGGFDMKWRIDEVGSDSGEDEDVEEDEQMEVEERNQEGNSSFHQSLDYSSQLHHLPSTFLVQQQQQQQQQNHMPFYDFHQHNSSNQQNHNFDYDEFQRQIQRGNMIGPFSTTDELQDISGIQFGQPDENMLS